MLTRIEALIRRHRHRKDLHITRSMGAIVVVSEGRVVEVDRTDALDYCPLQRMLSDRDAATYVEEKVRRFGHYTEKRELTRETVAVPFGTSEMFMAALRKGIVDCAVTVCDGVGTVISASPEIVQGIGARMNGLFYTTPIPSVIAELRGLGCVVFDDARIDQVRGYRAAVATGYRRIALTANGYHGERMAELREVERSSGTTAFVAAICTSGVSDRRARELADSADLVWSCASRRAREAGAHAILQVTHGIPIFVHTLRGLQIAAAYADERGAERLNAIGADEQYILAAAVDGEAVRIGNRTLYLARATLPVPGRREPVPLL